MSIEISFKGDKQGLGLTKRNKKRFGAQHMLALLGSLAHNVVVWARQWLTSPAIQQCGLLRLVRDVFHISGVLRFDALIHIEVWVNGKNEHPSVMCENEDNTRTEGCEARYFARIGNIKPTTIIVPKTRSRALLVGLGTTQEYGPGAIVAAARSCSSSYRAPEQYSIDVQTDIYGLGTVFNTLITDIVPTDALPVWRTWTRSKL